MFKFKIIYYVCKKCEFEVSHHDAIWGKVEVKQKRHSVSVKDECSECGAPTTSIIKVWDYVCPDCGELLKEDFRGYMGAGGTLQVAGTPYKNPIHSDSLALSPDQVAQHRKDYPYIPIDDQCRPVFTNGADHDRYMKECGIVKQPQKIKSNGKNKIYSYPGSKCS